MITGNEPYFPFLKWNRTGYGDAITVENEIMSQHFPYEQGVTIRQQFAMAAMQGLLSNPEITEQAKTWESVICVAVEQADSLIDELNKTMK